MKFKKAKSIIEEMMENHPSGILISMNSKIFDSLIKRGEKKGDGMGFEIQANSFIPFFDEGILPYPKNEDGFILIQKDSWKSFLSKI